jgi:hypothetical protein
MRNFNIPHSVQQCWFIRHILVSLSTTAVLLYLLKHYSTVRKTPREYLVCSCSFGRSCALSPHVLQLVDKRLPRFLCRRGYVHCPSSLPASTSYTHRSETKTTCRGTSTIHTVHYLLIYTSKIRKRRLKSSKEPQSNWINLHVRTVRNMKKSQSNGLTGGTTESALSFMGEFISAQERCLI